MMGLHSFDRVKSIDSGAR